MDQFLNVVKNNYANFNGRARRKEYWMYILFYLIIYVVAGIVDAIIGTGFILAGLVSLALLVPTLAVAVRRLHDTGNSGWFILLSFVPLVNLYLLYLLITEGTPGSNKYGANPKEVEAA